MNQPQVRIPRAVFLLLLIQFLAMAATIGLTTMLGKQVFDITGRELDLGFLGLAEFIPAALLGPLSGTFADAFDRRFLVMIGLAINAAAAAALAWYATTDPTAVLPIFLLVGALGAGQGMLFGSLRALPVDLTPQAVLPRVMALRSASWQAGIVVGPVAGGFLYIVGAWLPLIAASAVLAISVGLTFLLPTAPIAKVDAPVGPMASLRSAAEGLGFVRKTPVLLGIISLDLMAVLLGGAVALLPAIAEQRLGVGAVGLGWLRAAVGLGAAAMTLSIAWRPFERRIGAVLLLGVGVFGAATIVLGLTRTYVVAFAALLTLAAADAISVYIRSTLVPLATPEHMRGRVLSVESVFIGASNELGAFQSGVAGAVLGVSGAVVFGGVGTLVVVACWALFFPGLRQVDRFSDVTVETQ